MERRFVSMAVGMAVVATASCSLVTDLSGFATGAPAAASGPDASIDAAGDATNDAGIDATATPARSFCELRNAAMCTDFDRGTLEELGFSRNLGGRGALQIDEGDAVSAPRSLLATMPDLPNPGAHSAQACRGFPLAAGRSPTVAIELDVKVAKSTWIDGNAALVELFYDTIGQTIYVADEDLSITTSKPDLVYTQSTKKLLADQWQRLRLEATFTPGNGTVALQLDGAVVAERGGIAFPDVKGSGVSVCIGIARYNAPTPPLSIRYDNVVVEMH